jgi:hypothetical protein
VTMTISSGLMVMDRLIVARRVMLSAVSIGYRLHRASGDGFKICEWRARARGGRRVESTVDGGEGEALPPAPCLPRGSVSVVRVAAGRLVSGLCVVQLQLHLIERLAAFYSVPTSRVPRRVPFALERGASARPLGLPSAAPRSSLPARPCGVPYWV